jgi:hypothetical protein
MKSLGLGPYALTMGAASALLAGCGGSQPPIGAPGAMPQSRAVAGQATHGKSRMRPRTSSGALIYAVGGCNGTCVLSYPSGAFVQALPSGGAAICSDSAGNVFIPGDSKVVEYAHGGTSPIVTLTLPGDIAGGCAVDPGTHNLAVVIGGSSDGDLAVFANATGTPTVYSTGLHSEYCTYDRDGNLFVDGYSQADYALAELPKNGDSINIFPLDQSLGYPGELQWVNSYLTYESTDATNPKISRLSVSGSNVTVKGSTPLRNAIRKLTQSWVYGDKILVPFNKVGSRVNLIGIWKYPKGGKATHIIKNFGSYQKRTIFFQGVTVSVAPARR